MLKNKKGFTFVEILAAITILGILTGVAVVAVSNIIENGKKEHYETAEKNLSLAGQSYVQTNRAYLPKAIGQKTKIKLSTLVEKNYIQPIKDYSDNNCDMEASYVQVFKYSQNDYSYVPVLKCGSNGDVYDGTKDSETTYDPEITAQIVVDQENSSAEAQVTIQGNDKLMSYSYIVYRGSKEVKNSGSVSVKGFKESVSFKIPLTDYTPGKLKVVISATNIYGNDDTLTVTKTVADTKAPTCIIKLEDEVTSAKEWKTGTRKITVGCDDADGSGCARETYSKTFRGTMKDGEIVIADEAGNPTICKVSVYIDNKEPSCTNSGDSTEWINQNRTIEYGCKDGDPTDPTKQESGCDPNNDGGERVFSSTTKTASIASYVIKDKVGNTKTCAARTANVYVDKTAPSCTNSGDSTTWIKTNRTLNYGCSDSHSGCNTSFSGGTKTFTATAKTDTVPAYIIKDIAGNVTNCPARTANVYVDKTPPTCTNSGGSTTWTGSNKTITGTCTDGHSGCAGNATKTYSTTTNTTTASPGSISDNVGNTTVCPSDQTVKVDKTPPTTPTSGAIGAVSGSSTTGSIKTAAGGSTDAHSGLSGYRYLVTNTSSTPAASSVTSRSLNFTRACGKSYYAWAVAIDNVGNRSAVKALGSTSDGANSYSAWGSCSKSCGGGTQTRTNTCKLVTTSLSQSCNTRTCCSSTVDYNCGSWTWSSCTASCGGGTRYQYRYCDTKSAYDGSHCSSSQWRTQNSGSSCNTQGCCSSTYAGSWGSYGGCSVSCGGGTKYRYRQWYSNYDGRWCSEERGSASCNTHSCAPTITCSVGTYGDATKSNIFTTTNSVAGHWYYAQLHGYTTKTWSSGTATTSYNTGYGYIHADGNYKWYLKRWSIIPTTGQTRSSSTGAVSNSCKSS